MHPRTAFAIAPSGRSSLLSAIMKILCAVIISLVLLGVTAAFSADAPGKKGKLNHVVALKFKEGASKEQIQAVEEAFRGLKKKIKEIDALEWGTNVSPEKHDKGFTHCFILSFKSDKDRDTYLVHPDHKAFGKVLGPVMADVFVVDFWTEK
jgi:hypothetical protein